MEDDRVNLKRILMALRWEILNEGILLTGSRRYLRNECYIQHIRGFTYIFYSDDHVVMNIKGKEYQIPVEFEDGEISERIIDIVLAVLKSKKVDQKIIY